MKKIIVAFLFLTIIFAGSTGCKKIIKAIFPGLDADMPAIQFTLPAIPFAPANEIPLGSFKQHINLDSLVKDKTSGTFNSSDVTSVKIKQVVFTLSNPDQLNNLSNFESVRFTFLSNTKTDTLQLATITFPDTYAAAYTYTPTDAPNIRPYLDGNELTYSIFGKVRRVTTKPLQLSIQVTLRVR